MDRQLRVTDNVREQHMRDLKLNFPLNLGSHAESYFGAGGATSFWKRGSFRSESNIGSSRRSAGASGMLYASWVSYGVESNFCKETIARSGSPVCAATRARIS